MAKTARRNPREFASASTVSEVLRKQAEGCDDADHNHDHAMIVGMLGAMSKKSAAVKCDDDMRSAAKKYCEILSGIQQGKITTSDAKEIARITDTFISRR